MKITRAEKKALKKVKESLAEVDFLIKNLCKSPDELPTRYMLTYLDYVAFKVEEMRKYYLIPAFLDMVDETEKEKTK